MRTSFIMLLVIVTAAACKTAEEPRPEPTNGQEAWTPPKPGETMEMKLHRKE